MVFVEQPMALPGSAKTYKLFMAMGAESVQFSYLGNIMYNSSQVSSAKMVGRSMQTQLRILVQK